MKRSSGINSNVMSVLHHYKKPQTEYKVSATGKKHSLPNPDISDLGWTYIELISLANNNTGITQVGNEKLGERMHCKNKNKITACISILESLKLIHCYRGSKFAGKTYSNQYIFPLEQWSLPDESLYDDYICHPEKYKNQKNSTQAKEKEAKPTTVSILFDNNTKQINHENISRYIKNGPVSSCWKSLLQSDKEIISIIQRSYRKQEYYSERYAIGAKEYGLNQEEIDWILAYVTDSKTTTSR